MADNIRYIIAAVLIGLGLVSSCISMIGVFRFKFVLNRMHAAAIGDTLGLFLVLTGCIIISGLNFTSLKLAVIVVFFWISSPVSGHLIGDLVTTVNEDETEKNCEIRD